MADRVRVIAFDDNKDLREMFRMLVDAQADMVCVVVLPDLSQLMRDIDAAQPDVIVMDIQMPGMDGLQATRLLRLRGWRGPIIAMTANAFAEERQRCLDAGMDDHLPKPVLAPVLEAMLARWLAQRPSTEADAAPAAQG